MEIKNKQCLYMKIKNKQFSKDWTISYIKLMK